MGSSKLEVLSFSILSMLLWINTASALIEDAYPPSRIFPWLLNSRTPNSPLLKADSNGVCYSYAVQATDTCQSIAHTYDITVSDIKSWNSQTYGWKGCNHMQQGDLICLSTGSPPMPVALPSATCGPQVPGTARPSNYADLAFLTPCPSDDCCLSAGTCSTSSDVCSSSDCISNCRSKVTTQTTMKKATKTSTKDSAKTKTTAEDETTTTKAEHTMTKAEPASVTKASTTIASDEPNKWTLTAYTGNKCGGDYDLIELHGAETSKCFNIRELGTQVEGTGASCRYFTNGGFSQASCVSSPTDMVFWSFIVTGGTCTIHNEKDCENSKGINFELQTTNGCKKEDVYHPNWGVVWASLKCSTS
ncbi:Peptidoglycan-binding Lysin subgroup [Penicillium maclennaniae]|uniref:Peptidoglycan-binding Lysin subgroup n=1 Tax=Penicillium maclennaniae TaxID=1343394 RepID=UPI002540515E|nr:Peptidoglycan-binding Lysin subgroup [Penicillium maclennaniae]KAJ5666363.1 Peptidoglycan-binding Lysin subgroup [Penicillium maclennaniae]